MESTSMRAVAEVLKDVVPALRGLLGGVLTMFWRGS